MDIKRLLNDFEITECIIKNRSSIAFILKKRGADDPMVPQEIRVLASRITKGKLSFSAHSIGKALGLFGCASDQPGESWVFVTQINDVFSIEGDQLRAEGKTTTSRDFTFAVKSIGGKAFSIGTFPGMFRREGISEWTQVGIRPIPKGFEGLDDIDGFGAGDTYACGGYGGLWRYNGTSWVNVKFPKKERMQYLCCAGDGHVYVTTNNRKGVYRSRDNTWEFIKKDLSPNELLGNMVWFNGRVHLLTTRMLYTVEKDGFSPVDVSKSGMVTYSRMAARDGVLVITSPHDAAVFDGKNWMSIRVLCPRQNCRQGLTPE